MKVTSKDLRSQTRRLLEAVDRGEEVMITYRGKPRARLVPVESAGEPVREEELFGIWRDDRRTADVDRYMDELRRPRF